MKVQIQPEWQKLLAPEFEQDYFMELVAFLKQRKSEQAIIYPPGSEIFRAFELCPPSKIKAVIIGQDPYHGAGEAHGLCFSVSKTTRIPPSLRNIFKELNSDLAVEIPIEGDLSAWAKQGVFLLNSILTVEHKTPAAHKGKGWEIFTDQVIRTINQECDQIAFVLWGAYAKSKAELIDPEKHLIVQGPHPAAEVYAGGKAGFFGSKPFSKINQYLKAVNKEAIDWQL